MPCGAPQGPTPIWWLILNDYNFAPTAATLCETFPLAGTESVEKFNHPYLPMNCKFKFDTALM